MSTATGTVPQPREGARPPAFRTEATRLLSAGVYFDTGFRTRVIEELVEHEERPVAPSLGIDALPVLATRCAPAAGRRGPGRGWRWSGWSSPASR